MFKNFSWKYILYTVLLLYIVYNCYSMYEFTRRMDYILTIPVKVAQETREMKTRILEMQNSLPGLLSTPTFSYEDFQKIFSRQDNAQEASFERVKKLFRGDPQYIVKLAEAFAGIREARLRVARLMLGNSDYKAAISAYRDVIEPHVTAVFDSLNNLYHSADYLMHETQIETRHASELNTIFTCILGLIIMAAFMYLDKVEKRKAAEIESRDRLFNLLSENVDDVFIIARNAEKFDYVSSNSERLIHFSPQALIADPGLLYKFLGASGQWLAGTLNEQLVKNGLPNPDETDPEAAASVGEPHFVKEGIQVETSGGKDYFRISIHPILEKGKFTDCFIVAIQDQTEEYRTNQNLSDALTNANAANAAKSSFLSHMSHEIRTPMNAIIGMTTIALSRINDQGRVLDCLGKIAESSRHLLGLINDVLDMSKIENGKLSINREPFSLPITIQSIIDLIRPQAEAKNINFEVFQNAEEEQLIGDQLRLNQILLNILSNALKFTPAGGTISLKIQELKKWHSEVRLRFTITDTGIGMSEDFLKRIYKPFEQASANTSLKYGGTGLGMSITFNLVNLMGGSISVKSKEGAGSTFTVELTFGFNDEISHSLNSLPSMKVLVIDDDYGTCEHASLLLDKMGMKVNWALNGEDGIREVTSAHEAGEDYDVCFIDWKMPDMDGAETARRIRQVVGEDVLIIIISAYDWSSIEAEARAGGVNDFIAKPFFASSLYDALLATTRRLGRSKPEPERGKNKAHDFSGSRILLVEDNEFNTEIAIEFLEMVNAEVVSARNGQEGVDIFISSEPGYFDLVLMDIQMPLLDGYEATGKIRSSGHAQAASIPVIAMTANAFSEDVAHAQAAGMNGHIAKPIDVDDLYSQLEKHLRVAYQTSKKRS